MRRENKNTRRWPIPLVISVPKIVVNGLFWFNISSKTWSHDFFLEHSVDIDSRLTNIIFMYSAMKIKANNELLYSRS